MAKKILIISTSARRNSNSDILADAFRERIEEKFGKNLVKLRQKYLLYRGDNT